MTTPGSRPPGRSRTAANRNGRRSCRGFTLMEAMMASAILLVVVMSVSSAINAGQQHAFEAKQRIAAALAADELMCRLSTVAYADLPTWHGHTEAIGAMVDADSNPLPATFDAVGRQVSVVTSLETLPTTTIRVRGRTVRVEAFEEGNRVLCELSRFLPEPQ